MDVAIEINGVTHSYEDRPVLEDISVFIRKGTFFIIIGPNGSGKTTLMKLIAGIHKPSMGQVIVLGKPIDHFTRRSLAKTVAMVAQMSAMEFPFTVEEVVLMGRSPHKGLLGLDNRSDTKIARQSMAFTEVEHLAGRKLDQLSGGEQQRVFIARAICQEPEIILLDEPTAALDLAHQVKVMDLMERLQLEKGVTIVMVSHDVNLADIYANSLLLLKEGKIIRFGSPEQVLTYETLEKAYGCTLIVDKSPLGQFPRITLVPQRYIDRNLCNSHRENGCAVLSRAGRGDRRKK
jgi:iron complex transport system ATP-binding protein